MHNLFERGQVQALGLLGLTSSTCLNQITIKQEKSGIPFYIIQKYYANLYP